ncbi:hypothetical protein POJ06DRAFT_253116 [Lipomyces tetrasporus]|uniref:Uncharacterized protein n=1 Tax=Lipomyces tetrasporus TaxID=54092 RepID=A0AAD7QS96_9ASCO|nr:uncharacterized protein POJ06DRAFT_253116 [Lipomyces tetrasporus]KAJ8100572.1 hypothetical protein POJ06DRAFT_253116 [Lipomyces tetrasporus]
MAFALFCFVLLAVIFNFPWQSFIARSRHTVGISTSRTSPMGFIVLQGRVIVLVCSAFCRCCTF